VYGSGDLYGVRGYVTGADDRGVYGTNTSPAGGYGVYGEGYTGVYGVGELWGVYGSSADWGVYGEGFIGVQGRGSGTGVEGSGYEAGGFFLDRDSNTYAYIAYGTYGILTNGTKSFIQQDPTDASKSIIYAALEGGEAGTYYRGTAQLANGTARVTLPEHFSLVTEKEGLTVQVTPRGDCNGLYVAEVTTTYIVVRELQGGKSNTRFDFLINGVRAGYAGFQVEVDNAELGLGGMHPAESQPPQPSGSGQPDTEGGEADE
jgi:hypothetical protein